MRAGARPDPRATLLHAEFEAHRAHLWRHCYRLTGSAADADDLVQDTFRRALERPPADLSRTLRAWLVQVATNLGRDALRARKRRDYAGPWLPTPIETLQSASALPAPSEAYYGALESVSFAFLTALEVLSPSQRAVLLLRDVLDYSVCEAAEALSMSESNVKTTHHRARKLMASYEQGSLPITEERIAATREALRALCVHLLSHNVPALEALLARDVCAYNDGGGEFFAAQRPVLGVARVIKLHLKVLRRTRCRFQIRDINGLPALVADVPSSNPRLARRSVTVVTLNARGEIARIDAVVATDKLRAIDFASLAEPTLPELGAMLVAGLRAPGVRRWAPSLLRRLQASLMAERGRATRKTLHRHSR
jgi:RNA polymerase sigma-70 factor, ECF subfamily